MTLLSISYFLTMAGVTGSFLFKTYRNKCLSVLLVLCGAITLFADLILILSQWAH